MSSKEPIKITLADDEDGEPQGWILVRAKGDKFKAGERKALYEYVDTLRAQGVGEISQNFALLRRMVIHILRDWSFDVPRPIAHVTAGHVTGYENEASLDLLDTAAEDELLDYARLWLKQVAVNFTPSREPESPTEPSVA